MIVFLSVNFSYLYSIDLFKKNKITQNDRDKYKNSYLIFNYRIINNASGLDDEGYWNPKFENITIPEELLKKFTIKALKADYERFDFVSIKETFLKIRKNASWFVSEKGFYNQSYHLCVNLHNFHSTRPIHHIILSVTGIGKFKLYNYSNRTNIWGEYITQLTYPLSDGKFSCEINYSTYNKIDKGKFTAGIKQIIYWFE